MTIIKSEAIGAARKSLGEITYKCIRGRTIASQRITENKSNTINQQNQRRAFAIIRKTAKSVQSIIDIGFPKTKLGTPTNNFISTNKEYSNFFRNSSQYTDQYPPIINLYSALIDEDFHGVVFSGKGGFSTEAQFVWNDEGEIEGCIHFSRRYEAGDKVIVAAAFSYKQRGSYYEMVRMCEKELGSTDINALESPKKFIVNTTIMPELKGLIHLPEGATELRIVMTGIITGHAGNSTSLFMPVSQSPFVLETADQRKSTGESNA